MKRKALSVLSLAMKAGKVLSGTDQVLDGLSEGVVSLVILSEDATDNTGRKIKSRCERFHVHYREFGTQKELGNAIGKPMRSVIALTELSQTMREISALNFRLFECYFLLAFLYLVFTLPLTWFSGWLERRFDFEN